MTTQSTTAPTANMFHRARPTKDCIDQCCSGFYRVERLPPNLVGPSLTNPINPMFAADKFSPEIEYAVLEPSLRLATHLIEATLPFFYSIVSGEIRSLGTDPQGNAGYEIMNEKVTLTDTERAYTRSVLADMSQSVSFRLTALHETNDQHSGTTYAPSVAEDLNRHIDITLARDLYGQSARIYKDDEPDVVLQHLILFTVARTMVHELVHACMMKMYETEYQPNKSPSFYFSSGIVAEEGFEWESRTFGGIVSSQRICDPGQGPHFFRDGQVFYTYISSTGREDVASKMLGFVSMAEWPNLALLESYEANGWAIGCREEPPDAHARWNIDFMDIHKLFQDSFWTQGLQPGSLQFAKRLGQRFFASEKEGCKGQESWLSVFDEDGDLRPTTGVPEGYIVYHDPPNSGSGLILAPGVPHPFEAAGYWQPIPVVADAESSESAVVATQEPLMLSQPY